MNLRVVHARPRNGRADGEPALIDAQDDRVTVTHARFDALIDPFTAEATITCLPEDEQFATDITRRAALSATLPLDEGLLLHSAGIIVDGEAYVFYGVSGAGKSTFAGFMREVLSDELVAVQRGFARATGIWGTLDSVIAPTGNYPLRATIELGHGNGVSLEPITAREARRKLLLVAVVPPQPQLWMKTLPIIESLARIPAFRLEWTPSRENADEVLSRLTPQLKWSADVSSARGRADETSAPHRRELTAVRSKTP
jgi:hypothetical protein